MKRNASAILLILFLFLVLVALNFAFFVDRRGAGEGDELTADRSSYLATPYGTRAFYTLLEESHYKVTRFEKPFTELKDHAPRTATYHMGDDQPAVVADAKAGKGRVLLVTAPYCVANNGISQADNVILALN